MPIKLTPELYDRIYVPYSQNIQDYDYLICGIMNKQVRIFLTELGCIQCSVAYAKSYHYYYGTNDSEIWVWLNIKLNTDEGKAMHIYGRKADNERFCPVLTKHLAKYSELSQKLTKLRLCYYGTQLRKRWGEWHDH